MEVDAVEFVSLPTHPLLNVKEMFLSSTLQYQRKEQSEGV